MRQGLDEVKSTHCVKVAEKITADVCVKFMSDIFDTLGEDGRAILREKLSSILNEEDVTDYLFVDPNKAKKRNEKAVWKAKKNYDVIINNFSTRKIPSDSTEQ